MAANTQRRRADTKPGRATPKGGPPRGRYTAPIPKEAKVSSVWVPIALFGLLALGVALILVNYLNLLPGGASNWYLLAGLGLICAGFVTATRWR